MREFNLNNKYTIYTDGTIFSRYSNKFLTISVDTSGYRRVGLVLSDGSRKKFLLHRLLAVHFIPNPLELEYVNHKDGNKLNNSIDNLEWCTSSYNQEHAYTTGLKGLPVGSLNGRSILTDEDVIEIYKKLLAKTSMTVLAKQYGVDRSTISNIKYKRNWLHLLSEFKDCHVNKKAKDLSEELVKVLCEKFEEKVPPSEIFSLYKGSVTIDQIYDLKRRRGFKHITKNYHW